MTGSVPPLAEALTILASLPSLSVIDHRLDLSQEDTLVDTEIATVPPSTPSTMCNGNRGDADEDAEETEIETEARRERKGDLGYAYASVELRPRNRHYFQTLSATSVEYSKLFPTDPSAVPSPALVPAVTMAAIDCEMCDTKEGLELTRVSLVDGSGKILLDALVLPQDPILDYRSQWSGITATMMSGVTVRKEQVQLALLRLISAETVLVGHALENDLHVLHLVHRRCVDTSILYPHPRGFPLRKKLKTLARDYLHIDIQRHDACTNQGGQGLGHDSVEDARTALSLALLKCERGPAFGVSSGSGKWNEQIQLVLSLLKPEDTVSCVIWTGNEQSTMIQSCLGGGTHAINSSSNSSSVLKLEKFLRTQTSVTPPPSRKKSLTVVCLDHATWLKGGGQETAATANVNVQLGKTVDTIKSIMEESGEHALLLLTAQHPTDTALTLMRQKKACLSALCASVWSDQQEERLQEMLRQCNLTPFVYAIL